MRSKGMKRLVVDTSVACAAGGENATISVSINCTEFLETFRDNTLYHVVMTFELSEEWYEHQSYFAATWLANMIATKRFHYIELPRNKVLYDKIEATAIREKDINAMLKDFHLLGAALETDQIIISLEKYVQTLFAQASQHVSEIRRIVWVNLDQTEKSDFIAWLKNGVPPEEHRRLSA